MEIHFDVMRMKVSAIWAPGAIIPKPHSGDFDSKYGQLKTETANKVRNRIELVLDAAKARGLRDGENPCFAGAGT